MVNIGWRFDELMAMPAREFMFWFGAQADWSKRQASEAEKKSKGK